MHQGDMGLLVVKKSIQNSQRQGLIEVSNLSLLSLPKTSISNPSDTRILCLMAIETRYFLGCFEFLYKLEKYTFPSK